jgi:probable HAF family extracellular repeat protein
MRHHFSVLLFAGLLLYAPAAHAVEYTYTTIDVSCPAAVSAGASGINRHGQIVGTYTDSVGTPHGFLLTAGTCLTIDGPAGALATFANGLNDHGQIVGFYEDQPGRFRGFLYDHGVATPLPLLPDQEEIVWLSVYDINNRGHIVGAYRDSNPGTTRGFLLREGVYTMIDPPLAVATVINEHNQIVGLEGGPQGNVYLYKNATWTAILNNVPMGDATGQILGLNDRVQIVGSFYASHARGSEAGNLGFLWHKSTHILLDYPGSVDTLPTGINNTGHIVGSYRSPTGPWRGFLASPPPVLPGWALLLGNGRTPSGPAVVHFKGQLRAFVRGTNNRIYQTHQGAQGWGGWSEVHGNGLTLSEPGAVVFKKELYLFVRGTDNALYVNRFTGTAWRGWQAVPGGGRTPSGPAAVVSQNQLALFVHGTNDRLYVSRFNGTVWTGWGEVPGNGLTVARPAAAVFESTLYLAVAGMNGRLYDTVLTGSTWSGWAEVPGGGRTHAGPTAVVFQDELWYVVAGTDDRVYAQQLPAGEVGEWLGWQEVDGAGLTHSELGAAATADTLTLVARGLGNEVAVNE